MSFDFKSLDIHIYYIPKKTNEAQSSRYGTGNERNMYKNIDSLQFGVNMEISIPPQKGLQR